jgi:hypothetical protein
MENLNRVLKPQLLKFLKSVLDKSNYSTIRTKKKADLIKFISDNDINIDNLQIPPPKQRKGRRGKTNQSLVSRLYNLPEITEQEQARLKTRDIKLYSGTKPFKLEQGFENKSIINLEKHQKDFLNSFCFSGIRGAIAFHGVGTGKTNVAVSCMNLYLELFPNNKIVFVSPPVLLPNFIQTVAAYGIDPRDKRIIYHSYDSFYKTDIDLTNCMLVVDEAHNYRTEGQTEGLEVGSKKAADMVQKAKKSHKSLVLTGTAFVNKLYDIENLLAIANGQPALDPQTFSDLIVDKKIRYDYMKYRVSMYFREIDYKTNIKQPHNPNFPTLDEVYIPIVNTSRDILAVGGRDNPVYSRSRQFSFDKRKIDFCVGLIEERPNKRYVIYTSFLAAADKIKTALSNIIPIGLITGELDLAQKKAAIKLYNERPIGKGYLLIITKAGSEGVSLSETSAIIVLDGVWNEAAYTQIVARAVRFKSHERLPEPERKVKLYKLFTVTEKEKQIIDILNEGGKFNFTKFIEDVREARNEERKLKAREGKAFTGRSKIDDSIILKNADKYDEFDKDYYDTLKGKAKADYIKQFGNFMKDREQYLANELASISEGTPGTDFYMFALQKSKEKIIKDFIMAMALIPDAEQAFFDMDLGKYTNNKIKEMVEAGKDDDYISKKIIDLLKPEINNAINTITPTTSADIKKLVDEGTRKAKIAKQKSVNRVLQEFFTPTHIVEKLINLSEIKKDSNRMIYVLEPSAGDGAIVKPIIQHMKDTKQPIQIDMVEISKENRLDLIEVVKELPGYLNLAEEGDFLKYQPNKQYDYIIMNPPFHLKNIDKYDYDFVKRAYGFLKPGGVLVAVTGQAFLQNESAMKSYKDMDVKYKLEEIEWREQDEKNIKLKKQVMTINKVKIAYIKIKKNSL